MTRLTSKSTPGAIQVRDVTNTIVASFKRHGGGVDAWEAFLTGLCQTPGATLFSFDTNEFIVTTPPKERL